MVVVGRLGTDVFRRCIDSTRGGRGGGGEGERMIWMVYDGN